nr:hypothetical protein [uncultured Acetatifactor sp.]
MAWNGLALTVDGQNALNAAQLANSMEIRSVVVGDGRPPANFRTLKGLVHQLYEITDLRIDMAEDGKCTITVDIPKVGYDYYFREIGIIVMTNEGEKLYVYDNCGDDAQYIVSTTGVEATRKRIRLTLNISDVAEIAVTNPSILYVAYDDFEETKERLERGIKSNAENLDGHIEDYNNPHKVTPEQLGLDSTSDMDKPVSIAQQAALDELYQQLAAYTNQKIAGLINGAPESLDTLKEVADAIAAHKTIMDALDAAIGKKASAAEFDSHTKDTTKHVTPTERTNWNDANTKKHTHGNKSVLDGITSTLISGWSAKMEKTGDSANNTVTFSSGDATNPTGWADIGVVASGEKHSSLMRKFSLAVKNLRYLWKLLGGTSLAGIGDGTVTGAINALNTGIRVDLTLINGFTGSAWYAKVGNLVLVSTAIICPSTGNIFANIPNNIAPIKPQHNAAWIYLDGSVGSIAVATKTSQEPGYLYVRNWNGATLPKGTTVYASFMYYLG